MPERFATRACPSSCRTTDPKIIATSSKPRVGVALPFIADSDNHTNTSKSKNVRWTRTSIPKILPPGMDQLLIGALQRFFFLPFYIFRVTWRVHRCEFRVTKGRDRESYRRAIP